MKIKLYFYHQQWTWDNKASIYVSSIKVHEEASEYQLRTFLVAHEVEVPDVDLLDEQKTKQFMVAGLRAEKSKLQAETQLKLNEIDGKIQQLLAIEMKGEV